MSEVLLSDIIKKTREEVQSFGHKQSTLKHYDRAWRQLKGYYSRHNQELFSERLSVKYISEQREKFESGQISIQRYRFCRRSVNILIDYYKQGSLTWKCPKRGSTTRLIKDNFIQLHEKYINHLLKRQKSPATVQKYGAYTKIFLEYLELKGYPNISEVGLGDVKSFIPFISKKHKPGGMPGELTALRSILSFVYLRKMSKIDLSITVPGSCAAKTSIFPVLNREQEKKLLENIDRTTAAGKRNHAMLLLALRLGVRSVDIINLKLCDINWRKNTIEFIQKKTGNQLILPLLTNVGNAIADYITGGRPKSDCNYLFLRELAPYKQLSDSATYYISSKIIDRAHLFKKDSGSKGLHRLRRTIATRLLENEIPLPVISAILGHKKKDSTKAYLSADQNHLRACALGLSGIEVTRKELQ